jgi:hypothetical protein
MGRIIALILRLARFGQPKMRMQVRKIRRHRFACGTGAIPLSKCDLRRIQQAYEILNGVGPRLEGYCFGGALIWPHLRLVSSIVK